jgi:hypothetical protein
MGATDVPDRQTPMAQKSPVVQSLPSSHGLELLTKRHPVAGSQLSVVHTLLSLHTTGAPAQTPPEQVSPPVHAFPSEHGAVLLT